MQLPVPPPADRPRSQVRRPTAGCCWAATTTRMLGTRTRARTPPRRSGLAPSGLLRPGRHPTPDSSRSALQPSGVVPRGTAKPEAPPGLVLSLGAVRRTDESLTEQLGADAAPPIREGALMERATADFDLHGLAAVRLVDADERDVAAVGRQLGPLPRRIDREPDIVIRFVDRVEHTSRLRYLGAREAGWTDDGFFVLRSRKQPVVVRLPMDDVGGRCELVVERGVPAIPFLIAVLNLTVLGNGALPLHAAAFELDGRGTLVTGWSKGGKTELLMAAARAGARYIGDEWVYLSTDGRMAGIPEPIRLWDWHLKQLPEVRSTLGFGDRAKLRGIPAVSGVERAMPGRIRRSAPGRTIRRAMPILEDQMRVDLAPETLFGTIGDLEGRLDSILFVVS